MKEQINKAVAGAIKEMEPYKEQAPEKYEQLKGQLKEIEAKAVEMIEDELGIKYYTENGLPEELLNYMVIGVKLPGDAKKLIALIKRNL